MANILVTERCPQCGNMLRTYTQHGSRGHYGPMFLKCWHCGTYSKISNAIDLAIYHLDDVRRMAKRYTLFSSSMTIFLLSVFSFAWISSIVFPEECLQQKSYAPVFIVLFTLYFALIFTVKCVYKWKHFWKDIYGEAKQRLKNPEYADLAKQASYEMYKR